MYTAFKCVDGMTLNEDITITLPAHIWLAFAASYGEAEWTSKSANMVMDAVIRAIVHPTIVNEMDAAEAEQVEQMKRMRDTFAQHIPGFNDPNDPRIGKNPFE